MPGTSRRPLPAAAALTPPTVGEKAASAAVLRTAQDYYDRAAEHARVPVLRARRGRRDAEAGGWTSS
ncbi:hypothetical protein GCM10027203_68040 [Nonomuraea fastidiosa]|jgi:hypothetical protein